MTTPPPVHYDTAKPKSYKGLYIALGAALLIGLLVIVGVVLAAVGIASKRTRDREAMARFQEETSRLKADLQADADLSNPEIAKKTDQAVERMVNAAGSVDERMKTMLKTLMDEMFSIGKEAATSTNRLVEAGGIEPSTLTSREAATKRLAMLEKEKGVAESNLQRARNLNQTARDTGAKAGLSAKETEQFIAGMNGKGRLQRMIRVREIDTLLYPEFIKFVTLLRDHNGSWRIEDGQVVFSDLSSGVADRFNTISKTITDLSDEQANLIELLSEPN
jgi:hypothetical protein